MKNLVLLFIGLAFFNLANSEGLVVTGLKLSEARKEILLQGWLPVKTYMPGYEYHSFRKNEGESAPIFEAGYIELEYCSGTGPNYCIFNYAKSGQCLRVISRGIYLAGKYEPVVKSTDSECPDKDILINKLKP